MRIGMGDTAACGTDPCGLWDWVYASDACQSYLSCANPSDPRAPHSSLSQSVGLAVGQGAGTIISGAVGGTAAGLLNPDGTWTSTAIMLAVIAGGGLLLLLVARR